MSWVRIHDGAMQNLKITALTDSAFRLWVRGLAYCQTALTDGLIPRTALKEMGAKRKDVEMLSTSQVPDRAPLWEPHAIGFKVHDYLVWNDCRDKVVERQNKAKQRKDDWSARRKSERVPNASVDHVPNVRAAGLGLVQEGSTGKGSGENQADDLGDRARELLESYPVWYAQERKGARLPLLGGNLQWQEAQTLCRTWPDARLEKLARIVLTTDEPFIAKTDRGWKIFVLKASWADDKLRQFELENGIQVTA